MALRARKLSGAFEKQAPGLKPPEFQVPLYNSLKIDDDFTVASILHERLQRLGAKQASIGFCSYQLVLRLLTN